MFRKNNILLYEQIFFSIKMSVFNIDSVFVLFPSSSLKMVESVTVNVAGSIALNFSVTVSLPSNSVGPEFNSNVMPNGPEIFAVRETIDSESLLEIDSPSSVNFNDSGNLFATDSAPSVNFNDSESLLATDSAPSVDFDDFGSMEIDPTLSVNPDDSERMESVDFDDFDLQVGAQLAFSPTQFAAISEVFLSILNRPPSPACSSPENPLTLYAVCDNTWLKLPELELGVFDPTMVDSIEKTDGEIVVEVTLPSIKEDDEIVCLGEFKRS